MKTNNKRPLTDEEFDAFFRHQLADHSSAPTETNWLKIRLRSSLLFLHSVKKGSMISAAAAVTLICFGLYLFKSPNQTIENTNIAKVSNETPLESALVSTCEKKQSPYVLDIPDETSVKERDKTVRSVIIESAIEDYLALLLSEDDEFGELIDSNKIAQGLLPAQPLPIDEMFVELPKLPASKVYTILDPLEKRITLPHRFVESEREVEDFLAHYERNQFNN